MKKLYTLFPGFSPVHWLMCYTALALSLYLLWSGLLFHPISPTFFRATTANPDARLLAENISICGPSGADAGGASTLLLNEQWAEANDGGIQWSQVIAKIPTRVNEAQGVVVNGKLYLFGGFDYLMPCCTPTERAYVFNPETSKWTRIKNLPVMNGTGHAGVTHAGFTTDGTDIYFAGGYTSDASGYKQIFGTAEVWKYDVSADSYTRLQDLPMAVAAGALQYYQGKLHWIGGTNQPRTRDLGNHYVLDLKQPEKGWTNAAALPNPRNHLSSAVLHGKIYVFGGHHGHNKDLVTQDDVHVYDPATNQWKQLADLPQALSHMASSTFAWKDQIFILGGHNASLNDVKQALVYDPATNSWSNDTNPPTSNVSVANVINGVIYYTTDQGDTYKGALSESSGGGSSENDIWLEAECSQSMGSDWKKTGSGDASDGAFVAVQNGYNSLGSAPAGTSGKLSLDFQVKETGSYYLYARVKAPTHNDNSFWVSIDGGSWILWSASPLSSGFEWRSVQNSPFNLSAGSHTLNFAYREDGTLLDKVHLTTTGTMPSGMGDKATNSCAGTPGSEVVWLEAECGSSVGGNWVSGNDGSASEGKYLAVRNGLNSISTPPTGSADQVIVNFTIPENGNYYISGRVKAPTHSDNSFWVSIDGGSWILWSVNELSSSFVWRKIQNASFSLAAGSHSIAFAYREDGTFLDKIHVASSAAVPDGLGGTASNSCSSGSSGSQEHWLEAECADAAGSNWAQHQSNTASGGTYMAIKSGNSYSVAPASASDHLVFHFHLSQSGSYQLFGRVQAVDHNSNSFWVQMDNGPWQQWSVNDLSATFDWRQVQGSPFTLNSGAHTLRIAYRESNTLLDKLYIGNAVPEGMGEQASNCGSHNARLLAGEQAARFAPENAESEQQPMTVRVYPNPGDGRFSVDIRGGSMEGGMLQVYNLQGISIYSKKLEKTAKEPLQLDLQHLPAGVYIVQLTSAEGAFSERIEKL